MIIRVQQLTKQPGAQGGEQNSGLTRTRLTLRGVSVFEPLDIEMQSGPPVAQKMRLHSHHGKKKWYFIHLTHRSGEIFDKCTEINAVAHTTRGSAEMLWVIVNIIIKWPWRHYELWSLVHSGSVRRRRAEKCMHVHRLRRRLALACIPVQFRVRSLIRRLIWPSSPRECNLLLHQSRARTEATAAPRENLTIRHTLQHEPKVYFIENTWLN